MYQYVYWVCTHNIKKHLERYKPKCYLWGIDWTAALFLFFQEFFFFSNFLLENCFLESMKDIKEIKEQCEQIREENNMKIFEIMDLNKYLISLWKFRISITL